jgi:hypothetical protein
VAPVPSGLATETVGALVKPEPPLVTVAVTMLPADDVPIVAVAVAPLPPPPEIVTVGADAYPDPALVRFNPTTWFPDVPWQFVPYPDGIGFWYPPSQHTCLPEAEPPLEYTYIGVFQSSFSVIRTHL